MSREQKSPTPSSNETNPFSIAIAILISLVNFWAYWDGLIDVPDPFNQILLLIALPIIVFLIFRVLLEQDKFLNILGYVLIVLVLGFFIYNMISGKTKTDSDHVILHDIVWMKNNLDIAIGVQPDDSSTYQNYGKYYTQEEAKNACEKYRSGEEWRLPTIREFEALYTLCGKGDFHIAYNELISGKCLVNLKLGGNYNLDTVTNKLIRGRDSNHGFYWTKYDDPSSENGGVIVLNDHKKKIGKDYYHHDLKISCLCVKDHVE